ncbi:MAG: SRPBCC domain-containing protein [Leptospira sp.]|nr:SRPBCC domain-containing protein [Leptospira sp.]
MNLQVCPPDLSSRPFHLTVDRVMIASPEVLYRALTTEFDRWFAAPGSVLMKPEVNGVFFFETEFEGKRHPHYGRFLRLQPEKLIEFTWITGPDGTGGTETVLTIELIPRDTGTRLKLSHSGFSNEVSKNKHSHAWPMVLEQLDQKMAEVSV